MRLRLLLAFLCLAAWAKAQTYCDPTGYVDGRVKISRVRLSELDVRTSVGGYLDSTQRSATIYNGISYRLNVDVVAGSAFPQNISTAYIDWNNDFDFTDTMERIDLTQLNGGATFTGFVRVPATISRIGTARLRIILFYVQGGRDMNPCASTQSNVDGSAQDYTLNLVGPPTTPPGCPTITSPTAGSSNVALLPTFTWTAASGAVSGYNVFLDTTNGSTTPYAVTGRDTNSLTITQPLRPGRTYTLSVVAFNAVGQVACSTLQFTTRSGNPPCPQITSPAAFAIVPRRFTVTWADTASFQRRYTIRIGITATPTNIVANQITGGTYTTDLLPGNTTQYVQIVASDANGTSTGCPATSFRINDSIPYCEIDYTRGPLRLDSLQLGDLVTGQAAGGIGYRNFSAQRDTISSAGLPVFAKSNAGNLSPNTLNIYADWNQDGLFNESTELTNIPSPDNGGTFSGGLTPPATAIGGALRVRVVFTYVSGSQPIGPCGIFNQDGSAYDYTLFVDGAIIATKPKGLSTLEGYPSPLAKGQSLQLAAALEQAGTWEVCTLSGTLAAPALVVKAKQQSLPLPVLPAGVYLGMVRQAGQVRTIRLVID